MEPVSLLIGLGLLATLIALGLGLGSMAHGGTYDQQHSVQFMFARVGAQGITIVLLVIALLLLHN